MARRGSFIVFEGCDRAGKTTQCKKLVQSLTRSGIPAEFFNFPDRTTVIGQVISDYLTKKIELTDEAVHLLFSANRWELVPKIREKLDSGISLIVDRYSYSGVAFSAAKEGMDMNWCWNPEIGLPQPDAVFFLDLSDKVAGKRGGFGEERYEATDFQKVVKKNFLKLQDSTWQTIAADQDVETLHSEILKRFHDVHKKSAGCPLKSLGRNISLSGYVDDNAM